MVGKRGWGGGQMRFGRVGDSAVKPLPRREGRWWPNGCERRWCFDGRGLIVVVKAVPRRTCMHTDEGQEQEIELVGVLRLEWKGEGSGVGERGDDLGRAAQACHPRKLKSRAAHRQRRGTSAKQTDTPPPARRSHATRETAAAGGPAKFLSCPLNLNFRYFSCKPHRSKYLSLGACKLNIEICVNEYVLWQIFWPNGAVSKPHRTSLHVSSRIYFSSSLVF